MGTGWGDPAPTTDQFGKRDDPGFGNLMTDPNFLKKLSILAFIDAGNLQD